MSTEQGEGLSRKQAEPDSEKPTDTTPETPQPTPSTQSSIPPGSPPALGEDSPPAAAALTDRKPAAKRGDEPSTSPSTPEDALRPRQVIAVSATKGPAAFFNLARKFLVTDEMCDLSALEGAIVSAVDAAHLLERSKLATIVSVKTSYVAVEPKRRKQQAHGAEPEEVEIHTSDIPSGRPVREMRRARIVITVKRTESYKRWLDENPLQAIIAGDGGDDEAET